MADRDQLQVRRHGGTAGPAVRHTGSPLTITLSMLRELVEDGAVADLGDVENGEVDERAGF